MRLRTSLQALALAAVCTTNLASQRARSTPASAPTPTPPATSSRFKALKWRLVGPFRGGRVDAVAGDPTKPLVFYFGAVNGGVWKTTNGGQTLAQHHRRQVGHLLRRRDRRRAVRPERHLRRHRRVAAARGPHVRHGRLPLAPTAARRGSTSASTTRSRSATSSSTRAIPTARTSRRSATRSGRTPSAACFAPPTAGKTWKKVLFLNDSTGAMDLAIDPTNPRILFAAMWKFQRTPWGMNAGGGRSGLWKSTDGGDTWKEITFNPGIPTKPFGKIGVAISPANPRRVYASIEAPDSSGGIFRSDDGGDTWQRTSGDQKWSGARRGTTPPSPPIRRTRTPCTS